MAEFESVRLDGRARFIGKDSGQDLHVVEAEVGRQRLNEFSRGIRVFSARINWIICSRLHYPGKCVTEVDMSVAARSFAFGCHQATTTAAPDADFQYVPFRRGELMRKTPQLI